MLASLPKPAPVSKEKALPGVGGFSFHRFKVPRRVRLIKAPEHRRRDILEDGPVGVHLADQPQPLKSGSEIAGKYIHVGAGGEFSVLFGAGERSSKRRLGGREALAHSRQRGPIAARQLGGTISEKAAAPTGAGDDLIDELPSEANASRIAIG
jgi:hypothetical protein